MKISNSGLFQIERANDSIRMTHVPSGLPCGRFSHLAVRTIKAALQGVNDAESRMRPGELDIIAAVRKGDSETARRAGDALAGWEAEMRRSFPNGAWSR